MKLTAKPALPGSLVPVIYSQSPAMHNAAFKHLNLPAVYLAFQVEEEQVPEAVQAVELADDYY